MQNPYFEEFRKQPWVQKIADKPKWTICDNTKMPVDMFMIEYRQTICGAKTDKAWSLDTLDNVHRIVPNLANFDFNLQGILDDIVVLDIEPSCPERVKRNLLKLPSLYCEESMSGKGIHMVFPYPHDIAVEIPDIQNRVVLKPKHKWYEILINHFVTFTGREMPHTPTKSPENFRKLFRKLALSQKKRSPNGSGINVDIEIENIQELEPKYFPALDDVLMYLRADAERRTKTPEDYNDDMSTFEYNHMAFLDHRLDSILKVSDIADAINATRPLSLTERAWCVYTAGAEFLPYREKHDSHRMCKDVRVPWLLYEAIKAVTNNEEQKIRNQKEDDDDN